MKTAFAIATILQFLSSPVLGKYEKVSYLRRWMLKYTCICRTQNNFKLKISCADGDSFHRLQRSSELDADERIGWVMN